MSVNLTNAEIRQFELAGITKDQIGKTIERDRAAGLSDEDITLKAMMKADQLEKENPALEGSIVRGGLRAISNLPFGDTINRGLMSVKALDDAYMSIPTDKVKAAYNATLDYITGNNKPTLRQYLEAPEGTTPPDRSWNQLYKDKYNELRKDRGETFSENYTKNMNKLKRTFQEQNYDVPKPIRLTLDAAGTIGSYGLLPEGIYETVPRAAAFAAADSYQSGIDKSVKDRSINAAIGGITAGVLTGAVNKISGASAMKQTEKEYPILAEGFRKNPPKTAEESLERMMANYAKSPLKNGGRADKELEKLASNLSNKNLEKLIDPASNLSPSNTMERILDKTVRNPDINKGLEYSKNVLNEPNLLKALTKLGEIPGATGAMKKGVNAGALKPVNTEGLGGGLLGALGGGLVGGPWGVIAGGLLGSKGRIIPIVGDVIANSGKRSATKIADALVNPKNMSKAANAALKLIPKTQSNPKNLKIESGLIKSIYDGIAGEPKKDNKNKSSLVYPVGNNVIVLPESSDSGESITQKHLQLIAALDPNFFSRTKVV